MTHEPCVAEAFRAQREELLSRSVTVWIL